MGVKGESGYTLNAHQFGGTYHTPGQTHTTEIIFDAPQSVSVNTFLARASATESVCGVVSMNSRSAGFQSFGAPESWRSVIFSRDMVSVIFGVHAARGAVSGSMSILYWD